MLPALLLVLFPVLVLISVRRVDLAFLIWLFLSPFSDGNLIVFGVDLRVISMDRLGSLAVAIGLLATGHFKDVFPEKFSRLEKAIVLYISVFLFEAVLKFPLRDAFSKWTNIFDCYVIPFWVYLVTKHLLTRDRVEGDAFERRLVFTLGLVALYSAPMSIFEGLTGIDLMPGPGEDTLQFKGGDIPRANGPFWNPGVLGAYLSWILLLVIYRWKAIDLTKPGSGFIRTFFRALYLMLVSAGLYFVMFRNAWGGFLGGCFVRSLFSARARLALVLGGVLLLLVLGFSWDRITQTSLYQNRISNEDNIYDRLGAWLYAFRAFSEHPWTGIGSGQMRYYITSAQDAGDDLRVKDVPATYHPHNTLIAQLAENGLLGVIPFCLMVFFFLQEVRTCITRAHTPAQREFGIYAASAAFAILAPGMTDRSFEWFKSNQLMYLIFGLVAAHSQIVRQFRHPSGSEASEAERVDESLATQAP